MDYRIITTAKLQRLLGAAANLQELMDNGTLAAAFEASDQDCTNQAITAFDALTESRIDVSSELKIVSPFLRYRREILDRGNQGAILRLVVLNLYSEATEISLRKLFAVADVKTVRTAMELITHFCMHGDRDSQFMSLGLELAQSDDDSAIEVAA